MQPKTLTNFDQTKKRLGIPSLLAVYPNVRQKTWPITADLVPKQAEEQCALTSDPQRKLFSTLFGLIFVVGRNLVAFNEVDQCLQLIG